MAVAVEGRPWLRFCEPGVPHTLNYPDQPLPALLDQTAAAYGDRQAAVYFGAQMTFGMLRELVRRFAAGLARLPCDYLNWFSSGRTSASARSCGHIGTGSNAFLFRGFR